MDQGQGGNPIEVRLVGRGDLPEVRAAYQSQPEETRRLYHPFPFGTVRLSLVLRLLYVAGRAGRRWVAAFPTTSASLLVARDRDRGQLAGFGTLRFRRASDGGLVVRTGVFVLPEYRRRGVGRALKESMLERGRALGAERAEAFLAPSNEASAELNRRLGYTLRPSGPGDPKASRGLLIAETRLRPPGAAPTTGPDR